jgi:glycosyltransferase involved in cell wall biosynthesis
MLVFIKYLKNLAKPPAEPSVDRETDISPPRDHSNGWRSSDNTVWIAQGRGVRVITTRPNRSLQRNVGALYVQRDVLYFVGSDFYLTPTSLRFAYASSKRGGRRDSPRHIRFRSVIGPSFVVTDFCDGSLSSLLKPPDT